MPHSTATAPTVPDDRESSRNALICTRCGDSVEFEADAFESSQAAFARRLGFELTSHRLELFGMCAGCRALGLVGNHAWGRA